MKHQTNISELKRTFLETSTDAAAASEWEKRLSTSPVRLATRQEEAPMIEPLVPEEVCELENWIFIFCMDIMQLMGKLSFFELLFYLDKDHFKAICMSMM